MGTADLVRSALTGNPDGREALARAWFARVYGAALARTGNAADAEDLTQETFLRAFRQLGRLRRPSRFGPWILQIVRNASHDAHRRRHGTTFLSHRAASRLQAPAETETSDVIPAWRDLDEDQRLVCWLKIVDGMPFRDIGELLGSSKSAVYRVYRSGLERLRKQVCHVEL